mgnify:CR=1 FL=1
MTDNNTPNTTQQANTPPEGNGTAGKMFTQEEVNSIVKDRLARERRRARLRALPTIPPPSWTPKRPSWKPTARSCRTSATPLNVNATARKMALTPSLWS